MEAGGRGSLWECSTCHRIGFAAFVRTRVSAGWLRRRLAQGTRSAIFAASLALVFTGLTAIHGPWGGLLWGSASYVALQAACSYVRAAMREEI